MALLQYDFRIVGVNAINQAFASLERRAAQHNQRIKREFAGTTGRGTGGGVTRGAAGGGAPIAARAATEARNSARASVAAEKAASKERIAIAKAEEREKDRIRKEAARGEAAWQRNLAQQRKQAFRDEQRERVRSIRRAEREGLAARARREQFARTVGVGVQRVGSTVGGLATGAAGLVGMAGTAAFANAAGTALNEGALAAKYANQAAANGETRAQLAARRDRALKAAQGLRGISTEDALAGFTSYADKTGRGDQGLAIAGNVAKLALASGGDFKEYMTAAGAMSNSLDAAGVTGKDAEAQIDSMLRTMAGQANVGTVGLADVAQFGSRFVAAGSKFSGSRDSVMSALGAMAQQAVGQGGAQDAAEGSTALMRFGDDAVKNAGDFKKLGIDVFSDASKTKLRDPRQLIADMLEKTKGDLTKLGPLMGIEGQKVVGGFSDAYLNAERTKKGSGRDAVLATFKRYDDAALSTGDRDNRAAMAMDETSAKLAENWKRFNTEVGEKLVPAVTELVPALAKLTPIAVKVAEALAGLTKWAADNPAAGIGAIIAAAIVKEIASAGLSSLLTRAVSASLGLAAPTATVAPAATVGGAGVLGTVAAVLPGVGIAAYGALDGYQYMDSKSAGGARATNDDLARYNLATQIGNDAANNGGRLGAGDRAALEAERARALGIKTQGDAAVLGRRMDFTGAGQFALNAADNVAGLFGYNLGTSYTEQEAKVQGAAGADKTIAKIDAVLAKADKAGGGAELKAAAGDLKAAADALKAAGALNRGNSPSPVKP